jgi:hypothetical protein
MNNQLHRIKTIERINTSINECRTMEQVAGVEQFLELYYKVFSFEPQYFKQEWTLDTQLKNRKRHLNMLDDEYDLILSQDKTSLRRLDAYVQSVSFKKLRQEWTELRSQLIGIDISQYPVLSEYVAHLKTMDYGNIFMQEVQDFIYKLRMRLQPVLMLARIYK